MGYLKTHCEMEGVFLGLIPDRDIYEKVKNGENDWKDHVKRHMKYVKIPYELFLYLMEIDKEKRK